MVMMMLHKPSISASHSSLSLDRLHLSLLQASTLPFPYSACSTPLSSVVAKKRVLGGFLPRWRITPFKCNAAAAEGELSVERGLVDTQKDVRKKKKNPLRFLPWALGIALIYITREAILMEFLRWGAAGKKIFLLLIGYTQLLLQKVLLKARKPVALFVGLVGTGFLFIKFIYTVIVADTNAWAMVQSLVLSTIVLSLGEATRHDAVSRQLLMLNLAHLLGAAGVLGFLQGGDFLLLLFALTSFSFLIQRKDAVTSLMPMISVLICVAEPWLQGMAFALFLVCVVYRNWKAPEETPFDNMNKEPVQPIALIAVAVMAGMRVAAKCLQVRHIHWLTK